MEDDKEVEIERPVDSIVIQSLDQHRRFPEAVADAEQADLIGNTEMLHNKASPYSTGHSINTKGMSVIAFTVEEEFRVMDYIVRIEEYKNRRFDFF